jgi:hypothetical protein
MRRTYLVLVAFLQLALVSNPGTALAKNFNELNLQTQMDQRTPSLQSQPLTPNFHVGHSNQPGTAHSTHTSRKVRQQRQKIE